MSEIRVQTYQEFRKQYEQQHPASVPRRRKKIKREYPLLIELSVLVMFVCAALLSGVHTVPTVYAGMEIRVTSELVRQVVSLGSFVAIELAIFMSAYLLDKQRTIAWTVLIVTFLVATVSNVNSVSKALAQDDTWARVITLALGVGAPFIALMSGKLYIVISESNRKHSEVSDAEFERVSIRFDASVLEAWEKQQQRTARLSGRVSAPRLPDRQDSGRTDRTADEMADRRHATGQGYNKKPDARQVVRDYLAANPAQVTGNVRQIAEALNVGKSTVSEVQQEFRRTASEADTEPVQTVNT